MTTTPDQPDLPEEGDRVRLLRFDTSVPQGCYRDDKGFIRIRATDEVVSIDDNLLVPAGTLGTVRHVDDAGTIHVLWDNRTQLGLVRQRDQWERA